MTNEKKEAARGKLAATAEQRQATPIVHPQYTTPEAPAQGPDMENPEPQEVLQWDTIKAELDRLDNPELTAQAMAQLGTLLRKELSGGGGWNIYTIADAYEPRPPVEYLVSGLIKLPSLSIMYGPPGCLKTMLLVDLAACVAVGVDWLPPVPGKGDTTARTTKQSPVLWCDFDNGIREMHERIEAAGRGHGLATENPLHYVSMPTPWLEATSPTSMEYLTQRVKALDARLLIVDNLCNTSGNADENSSEIGNVLSSFRQLAEETRAAVILVHHQRKENGAKGRKGDTLRGHSSIEAALDLALLVQREEHAETIKLLATKVRGADVLPFGAMFTYEHKPGTKELAKVKFYGQVVEDLASDTAIKRKVTEIVGENPKIKKGELSSQAKAQLPEVGVNRIGNAIDSLVADGKLTMMPGDYGAKLYSLPSQRDGALAEL